MNSTWLVTGGTGFLGRHLLEALIRSPVAGRRIVVATRSVKSVPPWIQAVEADLTDADSTRRLVEVVQPEVVLHLAGRTPPASVPGYYRGNLQTTLHMKDALIRAGRPCRWVAVGSAAELGPVPERHLPIRETHPCRPIGAYGLSKWFATRAVLDTPAPIEPIVARVFNPIGPGTPRGQAFGRFAERLAQADADPLVLTVGDLSAQRDFIDARDVAEALVALAERGQPYRLYQVATGVSHSVRAGLDRLIAASGRTVRARVDPALGSSNGPSNSRAAIERITEETGWRQPRRPLGGRLRERADGGESRHPRCRSAARL